jgi:hypothetical protein
VNIRFARIGFQRDYCVEHGIVRNVTPNLLKQEKSIKVGLDAKRKMAGWNNDYLLCVLCPSVKS